MSKERLAALERAAIDFDGEVHALADRVARAVAKRSASHNYPHLKRGYMMQFREVEAAVLREVSRCSGGSLSGRKILDIGCGPGGWIRKFVEWGAAPESIFGIDALADRLDEARMKLCARCRADPWKPASDQLWHRFGAVAAAEVVSEIALLAVALALLFQSRRPIL